MLSVKNESQSRLWRHYCGIRLVSRVAQFFFIWDILTVGSFTEFLFRLLFRHHWFNWPGPERNFLSQPVRFLNGRILGKLKINLRSWKTEDFMCCAAHFFCFEVKSFNSSSLPILILFSLSSYQLVMKEYLININFPCRNALSNRRLLDQIIDRNRAIVSKKGYFHDKEEYFQCSSMLWVGSVIDNHRYPYQWCQNAMNISFAPRFSC